MSSIKKIVIFGSTGNTGLATVAKAIEKGYIVTAFLRDRSKLPESLNVDKIIQGDVTNQSDVDEAVANQDAVIIVLGVGMSPGPTTVMSQGTQNIVNAMQKFGVKRVTCCLSSFLFWEKSKIPERAIHVHNDHERMLEILERSSLEWIILCAPHIDDNPGQSPYKLVNNNRVSSMISKFDLADALVRCLTENERVHVKVGIGY